MRHTTPDSEVLVILEGKPQKGKIIEVITQGAARIQLSGDNKGTVQASHSATGEEGSFHYPDETKAAKESPTFGKPPAPPFGGTTATAVAAPDDDSGGKKGAAKK